MQNRMEEINTYTQEKECFFQNEHYSVRDNGAVLRHSQEGRRLRKLDDQWTFGKLNERTGYLEIASVRIHRIVATAFHGEPPTKEHVVDHIDTNKQNNRPENLRWVTRLENILLNPITVKRIETVCDCTIDEFLQDIDKYRDILKSAPTDISWMRRVSADEGKATLENMLIWAESESKPSGQSLGEWVYQRLDRETNEGVARIFEEVEKKTGLSRDEICSFTKRRGRYYEARIYAAKQLNKKMNLSPEQIGRIMNLSTGIVEQYLGIIPDVFSNDGKEMYDKELQIRLALTNKNYLQENWFGDSDLPLCPQKPEEQTLDRYAQNLTPNALFYKTDFSSAFIVKSELMESNNRLLVMYRVVNKDSPKEERWGIMSITLVDEVFVHKIITNYNGTLQHYWLPDTEDHFNCIVNGGIWRPKYNSAMQIIEGDYLESVIREYPEGL